MSQPSEPDRPAIIDEVGVELRRLFLAAEARERGRRRRALRRWRPLAVLAVLVLGGGTVALAAAGVFATGTPVGATVLAQPGAFKGVAVPGTVHLLSLRVPDPAGGPPWALRELRTTRGLECVQLGRLVDGRLGVLGQDGAFADDGRFHPLSDNAFEFTFNCATLDAHGHSYTVDIASSLPASGLDGPSARDGGCVAPTARALRPAGVRPRRNRRPPGPTCPPGSLRAVYFGMLGPDATTVSYTTANGRLATAPTAGPDGAFLIVLPATAGAQGESGGPTLTDYDGNPIRSVTYTGGRRCTLPPPNALRREIAQAAARYSAALRARFPAIAKVQVVGSTHVSKAVLAAARREQHSHAYASWSRAHRRLLSDAASCPTVGYVAPRLHRVTSAEVKTPIHARIETANSYCVPAGFRRVRTQAARSSVLLVVTWTTRVAITNQDAHYEVYNTNTGTDLKNCAGAGTSFGPTETDLRAAQKVIYTSWMPRQCPGLTHGSVTFVQDTGPAGSIPVPAQPGEGPDIPVGTFTARVP
jgi:hypothetical protein